MSPSREDCFFFERWYTIQRDGFHKIILYQQSLNEVEEKGKKEKKETGKKRKHNMKGNKGRHSKGKKKFHVCIIKSEQHMNLPE